MTPRLRKLALTAHVTSSVGWLGAVVGFLALAVAGLTSQDAQMVRAAYLAMEFTGWLVIVPLCFASLLTGLVQSLGTTWGLFRHYWILAKLLLTILASIVLLLHMKPISQIAGVAAETTLFQADLAGLRIQLVADAGAALLVLIVATTLSVYKPWGRTPYGRRKLHEQGTVSQPRTADVRAYSDSNGHSGDGIGRWPGRGSTTGTRRWVYVLGIITIVLVHLFVIQHLTGSGHGAHTP
jgi:hypothetical protein